MAYLPSLATWLFFSGLRAEITKALPCAVPIKVYYRRWNSNPFITCSSRD
jgi:hypothetical protein